jgi:hypothetical protein
MGNLIIKPNTGGELKLQEDGGTDAIAIDTSGGVSGSAILDEDAMGSNSATKLATQQSIKAYVDSAAPSNLIAHFTGASAPFGWSEYTSARGRMIVGLPSGGTSAGTVGTALTNAQNKSKSIDHTHTGPSHSHQIQKFNVGGNIQLQKSSHYGTSGTYTADAYMGVTSTTSAGTAIPLTNTSGTGNTDAMSANAAVVTADLLAYIQLMTIKKD